MDVLITLRAERYSLTYIGLSCDIFENTTDMIFLHNLLNVKNAKFVSFMWGFVYNNKSVTNLC